MIRQEARFFSFDGSEIYLQSWHAQNSRGLLIVTHGMAEHSDCYADIIKRWNLQDWDVVAWDLRGHGQSAGQRGFVNDFSEYLKDFHQLLAFLNERMPLARRPLALFGHSMGGLITFSAALKYPQWNLAGVALSSPLFGIAVQVPKWKDAASGFLAKYLPRLTLSNEIDFSVLSHDQKLVESYEKDPLRHEKISPALYVSMLEQMSWAEENAPNWKLPVYFQLAGDDKLVNTKRSQEIYELLPVTHKKLKIYPDLYHEIYNEIGKENVDQDLRTYLASLLK